MQVVLAEDTLHPSGRLVAIKIMKRQYAYTGQKVRNSSPTLQPYQCYYQST